MVSTTGDVIATAAVNTIRGIAKVAAVHNAGKSLCQDVEGEALATLVVNTIRGIGG